MSFLAALPLLLPPGLCACRFGLLGCATAAAGVPTVRPGECPAADHGCCGHRKAAARRQADGNGRPTASRLAVPGRGEALPAHPNPPHEPGCPALRVPDHSQRAEPNTHSLILAADVHSVAVGEVVPLCRPFAVPAEIRGPASPPLYLSFCTLLI